MSLMRQEKKEKEERCHRSQWKKGQDLGGGIVEVSLENWAKMVPSSYVVSPHLTDVCPQVQVLEILPYSVKKYLVICFKTMCVVMIWQRDEILVTCRDNRMNWEMVNYPSPSGRVYRY